MSCLLILLQQGIHLQLYLKIFPMTRFSATSALKLHSAPSALWTGQDSNAIPPLKALTLYQSGEQCLSTSKYVLTYSHSELSTIPDLQVDQTPLEILLRRPCLPNPEPTVEHRKASPAAEIDWAADPSEQGCRNSSSEDSQMPNPSLSTKFLNLLRFISISTCLQPHIWIHT